MISKSSLRPKPSQLSGVQVGQIRTPTKMKAVVEWWG